MLAAIDAVVFYEKPLLKFDRILETFLAEAPRGLGHFLRGVPLWARQRLHIARTLLHDPELLFLDEPTIGLDPVGARELRHVIRNMQQEKKTILLTTHYMFEADSLCERVAVINHGKIIALDSPAGLKRNVADLSVVELEVFGIPPTVLERVRGLSFVDTVSVENVDQRQALREFLRPQE